MMQAQTLRPYFLMLFLLGTLALSAAIFWPFLKPLALAAVFAVVLQGLYQRISRLLGGWQSTAALLTVIMSALLILLPLSFIGVLVGNEARELYTSLEESSGQNAIAQMALRIDETFGDTIPGLGEFSRGISTNIDTYTKETLRWITDHAGQIFSSVSGFLLSFLIFLIALYYLLRDGKRVRQILIELSPLSDSEDEGVFDRLELAVNAVIKGNLMIALIQGVLTTVGFMLFGVQNAILWGTVAAVAALIPGIGTGLVFAPTVVFLFFTGASVSAFGLLVWGVLAVGLIDNLLGPKLIGQGMNLHPLLVLLSVIGGLMYFGPAGIFLGPLSLSLLFALLSIYAHFSRK
ncbi:AI-2E family transporter [Candidatus Kaiserbacteria bacterium]|nr:AI-2E family transporter [Candidatus Kaiserbacteria bacterium]